MITLDLQRPLDSIRQDFQASWQPTHDLSQWNVKQSLLPFIMGNLDEIPYLTDKSIDTLPNNSLVRYKGMVQDILNPEYFIGAYRDMMGRWHTTKYSDDIPEEIGDEAGTRLAERRPFYCINTPGEAPWLRRQRDNTFEVSTPQVSDTSRMKRFREEGCISEEDTAMEEDTIMRPSVPEGANKHPRLQGDTQEAGAQKAEEAGPSREVSASAGHLSGDCLVHVYDESCNIKLHDMIDVVGVLSIVPRIAQMEMDAAIPGDPEPLVDNLVEENLAANPPTSRVFRLHALVVLAPAQAPSQAPSQAPLPTPGSLLPPHLAQLGPALRDQALCRLASVLGGDRLAAEYILLQFLSRVTHRVQQAPVGCLSLNITNCPADDMAVPRPEPVDGEHPGSLAPSPFAQQLHDIISDLVPRCSTQRVTVDTLNARPWAPRRDYTTGRLVRTPLQLVPDTPLILDECGMTAGVLQQQGIDNTRVLRSLMLEQQLPIDFQYYQQSFPTSHPVICLSQGRSIFKDCIDLTLPLLWDPTAGQTSAAGEAAKSLDALRQYMTTLQGKEVVVPQALSEFLISEFSRLHEEHKKFGPNEFNRLISLSKLMALSHGRQEVDLDSWRWTMEVERQRAARLADGPA